MDYQKIYNRLIFRAQSRQMIEFYTETHHVTPKCMNGSDDPSNLVELTPEEHYLAHQLLVKIHPNHSGLVFAAITMCAGRPNNKLYGWIKRRMSIVASSKTGTSHQCYGRRWITNGTENKLIVPDAIIPIDWRFGRTENFEHHKPTAEVKAKIGASNRGKKMSAEAKRKIAAYRIGKKHSAQTKNKISDALNGRKQENRTLIASV